jgi:uncharacterized protein YoxC
MHVPFSFIIIIIIIIITYKFLSELLDEVTYVTFQERVTNYVQFCTLHAKLFS